MPWFANVVEILARDDASMANDRLMIEDVQLVRQSSTSMTVHLDDTAVADFFDSQADQGLPP